MFKTAIYKLVLCGIYRSYFCVLFDQAYSISGGLNVNKNPVKNEHLHNTGLTVTSLLFQRSQVILLSNKTCLIYVHVTGNHYEFSVQFLYRNYVINSLKGINSLNGQY